MHSALYSIPHIFGRMHAPVHRRTCIQHIRTHTRSHAPSIPQHSFCCFFLSVKLKNRKKKKKKKSLDRKRPLGYHSNSYSWKGKERTPPFGQKARVCTGKQTNLGFSEGILPRELEFSFFDGEVNVNFDWSTLCALGRRTIVSGSTLRIGSRHFSQSVFLHVKWPARNLSI